MNYAVQTLLEIYKRVPGTTCKGFCGVSECGTVPFSKLEWEAVPASLRRGKQRPPYLESWNSLARHEKQFHTTGEITEPDCQFYKDNRCTIHQYRPIACRLFGQSVIREFDCQYGCHKNIPEELTYQLVSAMAAVHQMAGELPELEKAMDAHNEYRKQLYEPGENWLTVIDKSTGEATRYGRIS